MKFNIKNKTDLEVNEIIENYATKEQAEIMGFKFLLPLIEGNVLELRGYGEVKKEKEQFNVIGLGLYKKSNAEVNCLNSFPV